MDQMGSKGYPKVSKCSQKGTQRRQDCTLSNQMEPKECPKASKCAKGASRVSKVKPKATQMEPKGQPLRSKWRPTYDKCWIVMDSGIDFWVILELVGSSYCQQLRQKSMRKSVPKKPWKWMLKSMKSMLKSMGDLWKFIEKHVKNQWFYATCKTLIFATRLQ